MSRAFLGKMKQKEGEINQRIELGLWKKTHTLDHNVISVATGTDHLKENGKWNIVP